MKLISREGLKAILDNVVLGVSGAQIVKAILSSPKRRDVVGFGLYYPDKVPPYRMSLYSGINASYVEDVSDEAVEPFLYHTALFADTNESLEWVLDWLADLVQNPLRRGPRAAISIKGDVRTGKSLWSKCIRTFFYSPNEMDTTNAKRITGQFNSHLASKVLVVLSELAFDSGITSMQDVMKSLITDDTISVELKGGAVTSVPNHLHFIHTTNHDVSYLFSAQDVRWSVFKMSDKHQSDTKHWGQYWHWWTNGGKNLVYSWLKDRKYEETKIYQGMPTKAGDEEKLLSLDTLDRWTLYVICNTKQLVKTSSENLYMSYKQFVENEGKKTPMTMQKFGTLLNKQKVITKEHNKRILDPIWMKDQFERVHKLSGLNWDMVCTDLVHQEEQTVRKEIEL